MKDSKVRTLIIDDEELARQILKSYSKKIIDLEIIGECANGFEGVKVISVQKPDLIFLDIQMPKLTGFEMLELIDESPAVIFTTAYDEYALKAFEVSAVDYLLKPFSQERFEEAVLKAIARIRTNSEREKPGSQIEYRTSERLHRLVVKHRNNILIIPVEDILYFEAQDDFVNIVTSEGKYLKQKRMKELEETLPNESFIRIHRSYIINLEFLKQVELLEKESYLAILKNGEKLPISRNGYSTLKEKIR